MKSVQYPDGADMKEKELLIPYEEKNEIVSLPKAQVTGYLAWAVGFNVMNTIIYGALFPALLATLTTSHEQVFANTNIATTILSAFILPFIGSIVDQLSKVKTCLLVTQYLGIITTLSFLLLNIIPRPLQVAWCELLYIISMFLLRVGIMNNNAQLTCFEGKYRLQLSLANNMVAFLVNLGGLLALTFVPSHSWWGLNPILCWMGLYMLIVIVVSPLVFWSPSSKSPTNSSSTLSVVEVLKLSLSRIISTFRELRSNPKYRSIFFFLLAYMFLIGAGAGYTIFLTTFFLKMFNINLHENAMLNLYYKIAMIVGIATGMVCEKTMKFPEIPLLAVQAVVTALGLVAIYMSVLYGLAMVWVYAFTMVVGAMYIWTASISRGLMSKLIPDGKTAEFMALFSTATYIPLTTISFLYSLAVDIGFNPECLPLLLAFFLLPCFPLLYKTHCYIKASQGNK